MSTGSSHAASFTPVEAQVERKPWLMPLVKTSLVVTAFFANGNFSDGVIPNSETSNLQQYISIVGWVVIAVASYMRRPAVRVEAAAGLYVGLLFYAFAMASVAWSANPVASLPKSVALGITLFGAYRLVTIMAAGEIAECMLHGLFALCLASIALALFVPSIGVLNNWQHAGQWNGIFFSKQTLGISGALLMFLGACRLISPPRRAYHFAAAVAGLLCVVGSGSRGGGALAAVSVACLFFTRASLRFARTAAWAPVAMSFAGCAIVVYFISTGYPAFMIAGEDYNFTERTFIWQHALGYFRDAPWFGFGLNGFWTIAEVKDLFIERYHWFLDNFHDGYIAILMETGIIGFGLFVLSYVFYALRIRLNIRRDGRLDDDGSLMLVYTCMMFFIDFTETLFMRSTNISATLLAISLFVAYVRPYTRSLVQNGTVPPPPLELAPGSAPPPRPWERPTGVSAWER